MRALLISVLATGALFCVEAESRASETAASSAPLQLAPRASERSRWTLFLEPGKFRIDASFVTVDVGEGWGRPWTIGPDLWFGVGDRTTVGLVHSGYGSMGFYGLPLGFCMDSDRCDHVYQNVGGRVLTRLSEGVFSLAADGGVLVTRSEQNEVSLRAGVVGHLQNGWFVFDLDPAVHFGLNQRSAGNTEELVLPLTFGFTLTPELTLDVQSGIRGRLDALGESYVVPLSFGGRYRWNPQVAVGIRFSWPFSSVGSRFTNDFPSDWNVVDSRSVSIFVSVGN